MPTCLKDDNENQCCCYSMAAACSLPGQAQLKLCLRHGNNTYQPAFGVQAGNDPG